MRRNRTEPTVEPTVDLPVLEVSLADQRKRRNASGYVWATFIDANKREFAENLGWKIGKRLGCGVYGCVFESTDPWVVKITRDWSEGPTWAYIAELFADPEIGEDMGGFCRVNDVARLRPDVLWVEPAEGGGKDEDLLPVFAIQREAATPVFDTDERYRGETFITSRTVDELHMRAEDLLLVSEDPHEDFEHGFENGMLPWSLVLDLLGARRLSSNTRRRIADLATFTVALRDYQQAAENYWRLTARRESVTGTFEKEEIAKEMDGVAVFLKLSTRALRERPNGEPNMFGKVLGTSLYEAFDSADMLIADLHNFNVGWRDHAAVNGSSLPLTIVVTDPGVALTPWHPDVREVDLARDALERNGVDVTSHLRGLRFNPQEYESAWCTLCGKSAGGSHERVLACRRCEQELWEWASEHTRRPMHPNARAALVPAHVIRRTPGATGVE
jgi:hypothetical protein